MGIGHSGIVAAESLFLRADDALRGGDVVWGKGRRSKPDQEGNEECEGAHAYVPWLSELATAKSVKSCIGPAAGASGYSPIARRRRPDAVKPSSPSRRTA